MQIKSYILVRVTEALNFVSGLPYQIGLFFFFFVSVISTCSRVVFSLRNRGKQVLTFENWPSFLASVLETPKHGSGLTPSAARGACAACGVGGVSQQLVTRGRLVTAVAVAGWEQQ